MITALLGAAIFAMAPQDPSALERARLAYVAGEHESARAAFERALLEPDAPQGAIEFALGNCEVRLGRLGEAAWRYRRALTHTPRDAALWSNLRLVERRLGLPPEDRAGLVATLFRLVDAGTPRELLILAVALQSLGLASVLGLRRRPLARLAGLVVLVLGLSAAALVLRDALGAAPRRAVVLDREATLRADPHADLPATAQLRVGELVTVLEGSDRWLHVERAGVRGWVERRRVGLVDPMPETGQGP